MGGVNVDLHFHPLVVMLGGDEGGYIYVREFIGGRLMAMMRTQSGQGGLRGKVLLVITSCQRVVWTRRICADG